MKKLKSCYLCHLIPGTYDKNWDEEMSCHLSCMKKEERRRLAVLYIMAVLVLFSVPASTKNDQSIYPEVSMSQRCVLISTDGIFGTGVVLRTGLVVTNFHVLKSNSHISVNGTVARVLKVDTDNDLAYLKVKTEEVPVVNFGEAKPDDVVYYIGNPGNHICVKLWGRIAEVKTDHIFFDALVLPGASGSGLYNERGELIGIVEGREQTGAWEGLAVAIPASVVRSEMP